MTAVNIFGMKFIRKELGEWGDANSCAKPFRFGIFFGFIDKSPFEVYNVWKINKGVYR